MSSHDLHAVLDSAVGTFLSLMVVEALVKPIAVRVGRYLLKTADQRVKWLPDFLYKEKDSG